MSHEQSTPQPAIPATATGSSSPSSPSSAPAWLMNPTRIEGVDYYPADQVVRRLATTGRLDRFRLALAAGWVDMFRTKVPGLDDRQWPGSLTPAWPGHVVPLRLDIEINEPDSFEDDDGREIDLSVDWIAHVVEGPGLYWIRVDVFDRWLTLAGEAVEVIVEVIVEGSVEDEDVEDLRTKFDGLNRAELNNAKRLRDAAILDRLIASGWRVGQATKFPRGTWQQIAKRFLELALIEGIEASADPDERSKYKFNAGAESTGMDLGSFRTLIEKL